METGLGAGISNRMIGHLAEISMEVCDGLPSDVEKDLDYWVDTVKRFCPWNSFVKKEITPD